MSRYLVSGASGFIGRRLSEYLSSQGHEVWALLRQPGVGPWAKTFYCEIGKDQLPNSLLEGVDGVFHLANVAHTDLTDSDTERYWQVNVMGTKALLQAAVNADVSRFVYFSSVKAAADPGEECVDERWDHMPDDAYGRSKCEAEQLVLAEGKRSGMHVCNLRPSLVYGLGVKGNLMRMLQAVARGRFPPLPEFGNRRSMVALDDLISAAWLVMDNVKANGQTYIVADSVGYSPRKLYEAMYSELGVSIPRWVIPLNLLRFCAAAGDALEWLVKLKMPLNSQVLMRLTGSAYYRAERIQKDLGWQPTHTFFDVLPQMIQGLQSPELENSVGMDSRNV
ncbi:MAG: NAD-dependent epimerase/dehydratase family protein [Cycloclasticus sp.]